MMGVEAPETCWATNKRQIINLWNRCIWLVNLSELYDDARTCPRQTLGDLHLNWSFVFQISRITVITYRSITIGHYYWYWHKKPFSNYKIRIWMECVRVSWLILFCFFFYWYLSEPHRSQCCTCVNSYSVNPHWKSLTVPDM